MASPLRGVSPSHPRTPALARAIALCTLPAIGLLPGSAADAAVYRCISPAARVHFEQFGCPPDSRDERFTASDFSVVRTEPLSTEEQRQLAQLESRLARQRSAQRAELVRNQTDRVRRRTQAQQVCEQARKALAGIERERRTGYSTARDRILTEQEDRWQAEEKASC